MEITYKIKLEGEGTLIEREINEDVARRVLNVLMGGFPTPSRPNIEHRHREREENYHKEMPAQPSAPTSLREYLDDLQPKRIPDKILAIASFLLEMNDVDDFAPEEIKGWFAKAAEKMPANYNRDFRLAVSSGWITENHQTGRYYITKTGRAILANKFTEETPKIRSIRTRKRKKPQSLDE